jgi:hypothetical protein
MNPSDDFGVSFAIFSRYFEKTLRFFFFAKEYSSMPKYLFRQHFNPTNITICEKLK